jgi:ribonuclease BN (tRNA processing enzyme)
MTKERSLMCDVVSKAVNSVPEPSRRSVLKALGITAAVGGLTVAGALPAAAGGTQGAASTLTGSSRDANRYRTRLALLGVSGGPIILGSEYTGISTAIVYDNKVYVVDLGLGSLGRLADAGLGAPDVVNGAFSNIGGIFFTHMHSDHLTDWPAAWAIGPTNNVGRTLPAIQVFGPGNRGTLPRVFPPNRPTPPVINPENPTPGITETTAYLTQAWSNDFNDRVRDSAFTPESMFALHDIDLTGIWDIDPSGVPPRLTAPIQVWQDGDVKITATLVDHHPTAPAFGYRFDTPDGSIVISGDTAVSQNLIDLARGADYLVHEVIDPAFVDKLVASLPPANQAAVREHLIGAHTTIEQVGRDVAEPAGVKNLVLSHLVPGNNPASAWRKAQKGYSGKLIIGESLMQIGVGKRNR